MCAAVEERKWPPRSPYEALLSSPTGRKKAQSRYDRTSPTPSPFKRSNNDTGLQPVNRKLDYVGHSEDEENEDEETLQLRLQTLEAKLKLKKLQAKKARQISATSDIKHVEQEVPKRTSSVSPRRETAQATEMLHRSKSSNLVQVPLSPEKRRIFSDEPRSPGRVLLGIDKGLRGKDISLRRVPFSTRGETDDPFRAASPTHHPRSNTASSTLTVTRAERLKSFSERMAESRQQEIDVKERRKTLDRVRTKRSNGFGVAQQELHAFSAGTSAGFREHNIIEAKPEVRSFSRTEVMSSFNKAPGSLVTRVGTVSGVRNSRRFEDISNNQVIGAGRRAKSSASLRTQESLEPRSRTQSSPPRNDPHSEPANSSTDPTMHEPFSSTNLSRRILPHSFLSRTLQNKTAVTIPTLLRDVKSPDFSLPPALESSDFIVFGTIASKSSPLCHKDARVNKSDTSTSSHAEAAASETNTRGKYIVFTLTDLTWTLDLYLFTTAYTRFWKLTPGTVIAILNPDIMPPPPGKIDTGRFSLVLSSSDDTILELGTSKDLGYCKAIKKDGKPCDSWVDSRKTEYCEWHVDQGVERCRRGRMEVQGMSAPFAPGGKRGGRTGFFGGKKKRTNGEEAGSGLLKEGQQYDRETRSTYFIASSMGGGTAASLLDVDEDGLTRGLNKEDALRKRLAAREREKDIGKRLAELGNGTGADYLRLRHGDGQGNDQKRHANRGNSVDAGALGLLDNRARNAQLSPLKRKGIGKDPAILKKTRFVTARGIREAGRESLGVSANEASEVGLDHPGSRPPDEDDLDIV